MAGIAMRIIRPESHRVMPWKNGFGTTTEIAIDPPDAHLGSRFRWRLSIADVERSGPFSAFPGYERTIMVIAGRGMELAVGGRPAERLDRLFEPFVFSGDTPAECHLIEGPIRDFNLMVKRSSLRSRLEIVHLDPTPRFIDLASGEGIIHCFDGVVKFATPEDVPTGTLQPNCTAILGGVAGAHGVWQMAAAAGNRATVAIVRLVPV